jgi:hypothetical protein
LRFTAAPLAISITTYVSTHNLVLEYSHPSRTPYT